MEEAQRNRTFWNFTVLAEKHLGQNNDVNIILKIEDIQDAGS